MRPQNVTIAHDALYRVVNAELDHDHPDGLTSPLDDASDYRAQIAALSELDPMHERAAPMLITAPRARAAGLIWSYDWLGNVTEQTDDAQAFYERSIGREASGVDVPAGRASALSLATTLPSALATYEVTADRGGWLEVDYGEGGYVHPTPRVSLEPLGFTGKDADAELGMVYFGARYLLPQLGRFASADPMQVHAAGGGEALNNYHYVRGSLLQARDPLGLDSEQARAPVPPSPARRPLPPTKTQARASRARAHTAPRPAILLKRSQAQTGWRLPWPCPATKVRAIPALQVAQRGIAIHSKQQSLPANRRSPTSHLSLLGGLCPRPHTFSVTYSVPRAYPAPCRSALAQAPRSVGG